MSNKLFETGKIAEAYAKFRPTYGKDVYEAIINFCKELQSSFSLAVDVGCGSGQSTKPLAAHFARVIGVDVSEEQIAKAPKSISNLTFRVGPAEDLSFLENESVDLISVAQAMHWLNLDKFYPQVQRVLKPGGSFVSYGYGLSVLDEEVAENILHQFYRGTLNGYWDSGRKKIEEHYHSFSLPFPGWHRNDSLQIERTWSVDEFAGYLSSWSAWHKYLDQHPGSTALDEVREKLRKVYHQKDGDTQSERPMKVRWPVFMLMGHKPL